MSDVAQTVFGITNRTAYGNANGIVAHFQDVRYPAATGPVIPDRHTAKIRTPSPR